MDLKHQPPQEIDRAKVELTWADLDCRRAEALAQSNRGLSWDEFEARYLAAYGELTVWSVGVAFHATRRASR